MFSLVAVTVALTATATAQGVIGGNLDAGQHPAAGALLVPSPNGLVPECSGVLVAPRVFLTAGHCTNYALASRRRLCRLRRRTRSRIMDADPRHGDHRSGLRSRQFRPARPRRDRARPERSGRARNAPHRRRGAIASPKTESRPSASATATRALLGKGFTYDGLRHAAAMPVVSQTATLLRISSQTGAQLCFGDSGGPQYLPGSSTIVSVTSGGNPVCKGNATATRLDSASARGFLSSFVGR